MNDSAAIQNRQLLPGPPQPPAEHALQGAALPAGVCVCPGGQRTAAWPFCLQERGQWPLSSSCCENSVGKPEQSFHLRTHSGKNKKTPPEQTDL